MRVKGGRYITKSGTLRTLRSIKLTHQAWYYLEVKANQHGMTRGDLIQVMAENNIDPLNNQYPSLETNYQVKEQVKAEIREAIQKVLQEFLDNLYKDNSWKIESKVKRAVLRFVVSILPSILTPALGSIVLVEPATR